jgi:putative spermidine/putrescine transport system permease protein
MSVRRPSILPLAVVLVYAGLLAPLVVVIGVSLNAGAGFDFPPKGLSLRWYVTFFASAPFLNAFFGVSLAVGILTALAATVIGALAAIGVVRFRFTGREALETFFLMPLLMPHILLGAALYLYFVRLGMRPSLLTITLGHLMIATPYVIRSVTAGLVGIDPRLEEAAMSLGASRMQAFCKVTLPQLRASLLSGAIFAFIISFSDINLSLFLSGPGLTTLPMHIFSEIQWGGDPTIAAASALQIVIIGLLILFVQRVFRLKFIV